LLAAGVPLHNQFMGSAYNDRTRLLGDFGATLYVIEEIHDEH
jgi:alpha-galactosidase